MQELGQLLKQARLERKMSLEELEAMTKIRKRYLEAIEEGDYKVLPGNFYARAFVKSYAEAVGLDPKQVIRLYQNVLPAVEAEPTAEPIRRKRSDAKRSERLSVMATTLLTVTFVALIVGICYYFIVQKYERTSTLDEDRITGQGQSPEEAGPPVTATPTPASPSPTPTPTPSAVVTKQQKVDKTQHYSVSNANTIKLKLNVKGDQCWIQVMKLPEGEKPKLVDQGIFKNGEQKEWEFDTNIQIVVGKPLAVDLTVNGTPLETGDSPNPKWFQVNLAPASPAA